MRANTSAEKRSGNATTFGRYEVLNEVGRGAMGVVYRAFDPELERIVAIKTILSKNGLSTKKYREHLERFHRECRTAAMIHHPNIVHIYDVALSEEPAWVAMEFIKGKTLRQLGRRKGRFGLVEAAELISQTAASLDAAHDAGVVHRDVKPANIMVSDEGVVKLTDFGIVKYADSDLTVPGGFIGTPSYMSPEQVRGENIDYRSDIFSLGVVLYAMLTGEKPFAAENVSAICQRILHDQPEPPTRLFSELPTEIDEIMDKALAKSPEDRYESAGALAEALCKVAFAEEEKSALQSAVSASFSRESSMPSLDSGWSAGMDRAFDQIDKILEDDGPVEPPMEPRGQLSLQAIEEHTADVIPIEATHTRSTAWRPEPGEKARRIRDEQIPSRLAAVEKEESESTGQVIEEIERARRRKPRRLTPPSSQMAYGDKFDRPDYPMHRPTPWADSPDEMSRVAPIMAQITKQARRRDLGYGYHPALGTRTELGGGWGIAFAVVGAGILLAFVASQFL